MLRGKMEALRSAAKALEIPAKVEVAAAALGGFQRIDAVTFQGTEEVVELTVSGYTYILPVEEIQAVRVSKIHTSSVETY